MQTLAIHAKMKLDIDNLFVHRFPTHVENVLQERMTQLHDDSFDDLLPGCYTTSRGTIPWEDSKGWLTYTEDWQTLWPELETAVALDDEKMHGSFEATVASKPDMDGTDGIVAVLMVVCKGWW